MEGVKIGRKKVHQNVKHVLPGELKRHQYQYVEECEKMVKELHEQVMQIERKFIEKKLDCYMLEYEWRNSGEWRYTSSELNHEKMELDILTFAHGAYHDKKDILSFSSGEPEVNIHNLNYRMLHEPRSIRGERRLLNMMNPNKHSKSGFSLDDYDQQIGRLHYEVVVKREHDSIINGQEKFERMEKELIQERDQLYGNCPIKGLLWNSLPSIRSKDLRKQIKALERIEEENKKLVWEKRKKIKSKKKELRNAENEIKSLRQRMEKIQERMQKALQTL